jgi:rod shape-determining protein MreC
VPRIKKTFLYYLAAFLFLLLLAGLRSPGLNLLKPPLIALNVLRREALALIFFHRNFLQNEQLKRERESLQRQVAACSETYLENRRLNDLLNLKEKTPYKLIAAHVIARSADNWSSLVIIDKGTHHGIRRGRAVITAKGLAGRVLEAGRFTAKVLLINDPQVGVSAIVARSRQEGLVVGVLGSRLLMKYLPEDADIRIGDNVITSGLTGAYPKGITIGRVTEVAEEFSGLGRYASIKPEVNLQALEEVMVAGE